MTAFQWIVAAALVVLLTADIIFLYLSDRRMARRAVKDEKQFELNRLALEEEMKVKRSADECWRANKKWLEAQLADLARRAKQANRASDS